MTGRGVGDEFREVKVRVGGHARLCVACRPLNALAFTLSEMRSYWWVFEQGHGFSVVVVQCPRAQKSAWHIVSPL